VASTGSAFSAAYREAAWKVQLSARFCADPARAARLRSLAALHQQQADRLDGGATTPDQGDSNSR